MPDNPKDHLQIDPTIPAVPAAPDVVNVGGPERGLVVEVPVVNSEAPTALEAAGEFSPTQLATHQNPTVVPEIKDYLQVTEQASKENLSVPVVAATGKTNIVLPIEDSGRWEQETEERQKLRGQAA